MLGEDGVLSFVNLLDAICTSPGVLMPKFLAALLPVLVVLAIAGDISTPDFPAP